MNASLVGEGAVAARYRRKSEHAKTKSTIHSSSHQRGLWRRGTYVTGFWKGMETSTASADEILDFSEHGEVVLGLDVFRVSGV